MARQRDVRPVAAKTKPSAKREPLRRCSRCRKDKPRSEFPRNRATADGLGLYCRQCKRDADRSRTRAPGATPPAEAPTGAEHPRAPELGEPRNSETPRAPALAITDALLDRAASIIRETAATRRAAARHVGVSENTFKGWLREAGDLKDDNDPRRRLLFAVEMAEGEAELTLTRAYFVGARIDPQVAQRFLERRFSKGDEKWARTEHVSVTDGDAAPMEVGDARKLLADKLEKLFGGGRGAGPPGGGGAGSPDGAPAEAPAAAESGATDSAVRSSEGAA